MPPSQSDFFLINGIMGVLTTLVSFGGIVGIIVAVGWSRAERIRAQAKAAQLQGEGMPSESVLAELHALKQQVSDMQSTTREFDLSVDDALNRLESRLIRLETKATPARVMEEDTAHTIHAGRRKV